MTTIYGLFDSVGTSGLSFPSIRYYNAMIPDEPYGRTVMYCRINTSLVDVLLKTS